VGKAIPFKVDAGFLVQLFVNPTITRYLNKEFNEDTRAVMITDYFALEMYAMIAKEKLKNEEYIKLLQNAEYLNVKMFEDLFGIKKEKQKAMRSRLHDPLPYTQAGDNTNILYKREEELRYLVMSGVGKRD
jgi:hypothetical protein